MSVVATAIWPFKTLVKIFFILLAWLVKQIVLVTSVVPYLYCPPEAKLSREAEIRYCTVAMVTDYDCWHPDHDEVDVSMVIQTLMNNASNAQNMIKEVIKTFRDFSVDKDPANNCLDVAIITDSKFRTKKTLKKLNNIAGRVLNKK